MSVGHLLGKEGVSLVDSHAQEVVALQNTLDFVDAQINQHTSNLGGFVTLKMLHEVVNCGSNLLLVVWVLVGNSLDDLIGLQEVGLLNAGWLLLVSWLHHWGTHRSSDLLHRLSHVLTHWHVWLHVLSHWHVILRSALRAIVLTWVVVWLLTTVEVARALLRLVLTVTTLGALSLCAGCTSLLVLIWRECCHNAGKLAKEFLLVDGLTPRILSVFFSPLTKPNFVSGLFVLELSDLLNFVMVDDERAGLTCDWSVVELFLGSRGSIWLSKADETEEVFIFTCSLIIFREESDALNFTKWREKFTNGLFSRFFRNVLDIQVASLL